MMEGESGLLACIKTILGERILPSCELAMTTIPTEVALRAETREPVLKMSAGVREAFTRAEAGLKRSWPQTAMTSIATLGPILTSRNCRRTQQR
jgi:hypothetical protein